MDNWHEFEAEHRALINELLAINYFREEITDKLVMQAMRKVQRHMFVPPEYRSEAYFNGPLPIGFNQTISQPFIIAYMMSVIEIDSCSKVLEIGTGSGYQTALLCEIAKFVFSVERIESLANGARQILRDLAYENVEVSVHDGSIGWHEKAPFDGIIVSAEMPDFPQALFNQLAEGGKLVAPVKSQSGTNLMVVTNDSGFPQIRWDIGVRFVPLIGEEGY